MKPASPKLTAALQDLYFDERVAENQYLSHYATVKNRGLTVFAAQLLERAGDERKHADRLAERIAMFESAPLAYKGTIVPETGREMVCDDMLTAEVEAEQIARAKYEKAIMLCCEVGDNDTRDILVANLKDETEHVHEIEVSQNLIELIGFENWAQAML